MDSSSDLFQKIHACSVVNSDIIARLEAFDSGDVVVTSFCISKIALDFESEKSPTVTFPNAKTTKNICEQIKRWKTSKPVSFSFPNFFRHELKRDVSTFEDVKWAQSELNDLIEKYNILREDQLIKFLGELRMILSKLEEVQVLLGEIESLTVSVKSSSIKDSKKSEAGNLISQALECLDINPSDSESEWRLYRFDKAPPSPPNGLEKFGDLSHFLNVLIESESTGLNRAMASAAFIKRKDLVLFFIEKGADMWDMGMSAAAEGGHIDIVKFFIEKGADDWDMGMSAAAEGGHIDIVKFFIEKGADDWNWGMCCAAKGGHIDIVKFFIEKGADDWNWGMCCAAKGGHIDLIEFFIEKGADDLFDAIEHTSVYKQTLAEEFLKKKLAEIES